MTAPESKWVDEAMDLVTLAVAARQRDGVLRQTKLFPEARDKLASHLQRQADLCERLADALRLTLAERTPAARLSDACQVADGVLTEYERSKQ